MTIYLISYDVDSEEDRDSLFHLLNSIGKAIKIHTHAILLASDFETSEINQEIHTYYEHVDQWVITKVDPDFTGRSRETDRINRFLSNNGFRHPR